MELGMSPESWLLSTFNISKAIGNRCGIPPLNLLSDKSKNCREFISPIETGMPPPKELFHMLRNLNDGSFPPISSGMLPSRELLERSR
ncbi:hypothetical protein V6N13_136221 [Hibiscus sabdariffa]